MKSSILKKVTTTAMLTAVALILGYFSFPIFPAVAFLEYDLCDVVILITSFLFGPLYGVASSLIVAFFQAILLDKSGIFGLLMNVVSTVSFILPSAIIYYKNKTKKRAVISLVVGAVFMNVVMVIFNLFVTPKFMGVPVAVVIDLLIFIVLFNVIKSAVNSVVTFFLYKHIGKLIKRF